MVTRVVIWSGATEAIFEFWPGGWDMGYNGYPQGETKKVKKIFFKFFNFVLIYEQIDAYMAHNNP